MRDALRDRYAVAGEIGRGGMAVVCRATDLRHGREVAIKVLLPELARAVTGDRFLREISILARLAHPNILPLLDSGTVEVVPGLDVPWYVMPYIAEETLRARLDREGALPVAEALRLTRELCEALMHAHRLGIVHRDIKPENILLPGGQAVLADFGIARAVTLSGTSSLSSTGLVIGTPAYMSPEQSAGSEKLDARSDLYSLGVVLYEMLAGQPPFTGATPQAISARHQFEAPPPIRVVRPSVPAGLEVVLGRLLEKVPADRYGSAEEVARAVGAQPAGEGMVPRTPEVPGARRFPKPRWLVAAGVAVGLGIAAVVAARSLQPVPDQPAVDPERIVVLPFKHLEMGTQALISGVNCEFLIDQALDEFRDLRRVDRLAVGSALEAHGIPTTLDSGRALARRLGAGRLVWGEVWQEGDSLRVRGVVFPTVGPATQPLYSAGIALPISLAEAGGRLVAAKFAELALDLALMGRAGPAPRAPMLTASFEALVEGAIGDSARNAWELAGAEQRFLRALELDPKFALMQARLGEIGNWRQDPVEEWRPRVVAALREPERLTSYEKDLAEAALALANEDYPDACARFRQLLARDTADVRALIGLGDCLRLDDVVLPDPSSPSKWRFRTSLDEAARLYLRAFRLTPTSHRAYFEVVGWRLSSVLFTNRSQVRHGVAADSSQMLFAAKPSLIADTIALVPYPASRESSSRPSATSDPGALDRGRWAFDKVTAAWVAAFPRSPIAAEARATALESAGLAASRDSAGPLGLVRRALVHTTDPEGRVRLGRAQVRLLLKAGEYTKAGSLIDSMLLTGAGATGRRAAQLAPLAALRGRVEEAVRLLQASGENFQLAPPDGMPVDVPGPIRATAAALYVYGAIGGTVDSFLVVEQRLDRQIEAWASGPAMRQYRAAALLLPAVLGFPSMGARPIHAAPTAWYLPILQRRLASGDTDWVRQQLREIEALPVRLQNAPGDLALEIAFQESWIHLAVGDTAAALKGVSLALEGLQHSGRLDLLRDCQSAAGLLRALELRASIGSAIGHPDAAAWRMRVAQLRAPRD